jgi:hypothetical protein
MDAFLAGRKNDDPTHVDFVPSVFRHRNAGRHADVERYNRRKDRSKIKDSATVETLKEDGDREAAAASLLELSCGQPRFVDKG